MPVQFRIIMMKKLLFLGSVLLVIAFFFLSGAIKFITLEALKENRDLLSQFHEVHPFGFPLLFIGLYIVQTSLSLPGATVMTLAAGAIFGAVAGTSYAVIGATCGAAVCFLFVRYLLHDVVQQRFGKRLEDINREMDRSGINYLLFLRLVPLFPFFAVNLAAALTRLRFPTFVAGTFLGIIPGGFVYANAGASLSTINRLSDVASPRVMGAFVLLGLFALVPVVYRKTRKGRA